MKHFRKLFALVLALALILSAVSFARAEGALKTITILGTTDLHGNIWGYSYEDNKETANNGMARVYTYVEQVRAETPNVILLDAGDTVQGTIMTDDLYNKEEGEHPVITAMNLMGYDAMTLGNHEFNFGVDLVARLQKLANFPLLSANTTVAATGEKFVDAYTIVERDGVRVAVIGVTTPNIPVWDGDKVATLAFEGMSSAVKRTIEAIGDQADVLVVCAHAGQFAEFDEDNGTDAANKILEDNPEIDVLMVGHMHVTVNDKSGKTLIGGARNGGREVVRFDLTIGADNKVTDGAVSVVDMADVTPSEALRADEFIKTAHQRTIDFIQGSGSAEGGAAGGIFGQASARFQPEDEIKGIPEGKLRDTAVMDLINKVQLLNSGADVSAAALFKDTSDIPAGDINYGTIFNIYKFDNTLYRVTVTGAELKAYMEWSAACYNGYTEGDLNVSFNPEKPGYLYDMFAGVDYKIDLSKPAGERIVDVMFKGEPLQDDQTLTLAVNNYRYSSALKQYNLVSGKREWESAGSIRDMLVKYITEQGTITPEVDNNWEIIGVNFDSPYREALIEKINAGEIEPPYAKSLNVNDEAVKAIIDTLKK